MTIKFEEIGQELVEMLEKDQEHIGEVNVDWEQVKESDRKIRERLKQIILEIGWPTISKVGRRASHAAWLIAQHSDLDFEFQKYCLELMRSQRKDEVNQYDIAYLTDRVMITETGKQRYGTQMRDRGEYLVLHPLEDSSNLDKLREEVGLEPISDYLARQSKPAYINETEAAVK